MSKFINVTSHTLTEDQKRDAIASFDVTEFVELPTNLKQMWGNVPTDLKSVHEWIEPFYNFMLQNGEDGGAIVLCQGDIGAVFALVNLVYDTDGFQFIQSTTSRVDTVEEDGVKKSVFKHVRFRTYSFGKIDPWNM